MTPRVPRRAETLSADGTSIAFTEMGSGPTVLMAHGTGLSEVVWRGLGYTALLDGFHVVGVDLRGQGRSGKPHQSEDYAFDSQVYDLIAVMDRVEAETVHLVGYSLGACIGFHLARREPQRVSSFVSLGGRFGPLRGGAAEIFFPNCIQTLTEHGMDGFVQAWSVYRDAPVDPATIDALRRNDPLSLAALLTSLERETGISPDELAGIPSPVLLIAGDRDTAGVEAARVAEAFLPDATAVTIPEIDHAGLLRDRRTATLTARFVKASRANRRS